MADALTARQTYDKMVGVGEAKVGMPGGRAFVLAVLAGALIGLGGMMLLLVKGDGALSPSVSALLGGLCFSLGLFAVVMCGAELFTGNSLMVLGAARGRYGWGEMLARWALVYAGNLVGSLAVAVLLHLCGFSAAGGAVGSALGTIADAKCSLPPVQLLARAAMCNLLVCLGVWIAAAGRSACDRLAAVALPVTAFVACGFEHSVANMMLLPLALIEGVGGSPAGLAANLAFVTVGNVVGGALLFGGVWAAAFGGEADE